MTEGWHNNDYLVLFGEVEDLTEAYGLPQYLPGYRLVGLKGWDDFIVADASGATFTVPTVPLSSERVTPFAVPPASVLRTDARFTGKVKWYVQPIAFGGSPDRDDNVAWIDVNQHISAVRWWNDNYRKLISTSGD